MQNNWNFYVLVVFVFDISQNQDFLRTVNTFHYRFQFIDLYPAYLINISHIKENKHKIIKTIDKDHRHGKGTQRSAACFDRSYRRVLDTQHTRAKKPTFVGQVLIAQLSDTTVRIKQQNKAFHHYSILVRIYFKHLCTHIINFEVSLVYHCLFWFLYTENIEQN